MIARILDCTQEEYFADPCEVPALSQSVAHTLLTASPLHAWTKHPRFGAQTGDRTKSTSDGSLIHKLILGKGQEVVVINADDFRSKLAREQRDAALAAGHLPVVAAKYHELEGIANTLISRFEDLGYSFDGRSEVPFEWDENGEHGLVRCKAMMDHVHLERLSIFDVKSIHCAHPSVCSKHMIEYGYCIQWAAYTSCMEKFFETSSGVSMTFLFGELTAPYSAVPAVPNRQMRELGRAHWRRAVLLWEKCLRENHWPGYVEKTIELAPPAWAIGELSEVTTEDFA